MTYTTSITKTKSAQYDLLGIKDMVPNIWVPVKVAHDKHVLWGISYWRQQLTHVEVMRKHGYGYLKEIVVRRTDNDLYRFKEEDWFLGNEPKFFNSESKVTRYEDNITKARNTQTPTSEKGDRTLTGLRTSLDDITKNIRMEYLPKRRWSTLEKKRANIMNKVIDKQLKERRMIRSLKKFVGGRHYGTELRLLQRTI
ncbi:hypothetical protein Tco_0610136 [Tanacetum coccineum]